MIELGGSHHCIATYPSRYQATKVAYCLNREWLALLSDDSAQGNSRHTYLQTDKNGQADVEGYFIYRYLEKNECRPVPTWESAELAVQEFSSFVRRRIQEEVEHLTSRSGWDIEFILQIAGLDVEYLKNLLLAIDVLPRLDIVTRVVGPHQLLLTSTDIATGLSRFEYVSMADVAKEICGFLNEFSYLLVNKDATQPLHHLLQVQTRDLSDFPLNVG
jgi:hypothetical protein